MNYQVDDTDRRILRALQRDATLSMDALAEVAHLSRNACWRRMKQMEEAGVIRGRVVLIDPACVGLPLTAFVMIRTNAHDADWLDRFASAVRALPEIQSAHRLTGDLDYVLRVRLTSMADYDRFYKALIARVPLSDVSASFVMEDIKDTTALPV